MNAGWGWAGAVTEFLTASDEDLLIALRDHHRRLLVMNPAGTQASAWREELRVMRASLVALPSHLRSRSSVVFEYELPLEGGRRPDVVVLAGDVVLAVEFKVGTMLPSTPMLDQAAAYARDLAEYHEGSYGHMVDAVLVPTRATGVDRRSSGVRIVAPDQLATAIASSAGPGSIDLEVWLRAAYVPLPRLVTAARRIFRDEPLHHVRRARSAGIPAAVDLLQEIAGEAQSGQKRTSPSWPVFRVRERPLLGCVRCMRDGGPLFGGERAPTMRDQRFSAATARSSRCYRTR
jgi:hypothetical protein